MELTGFGAMEGTELLQKLPLFAQLTFDETVHLGAIVQPIRVEPGTVLIEERALGNALFIIQEGEVTVSRDANGDGKTEEWETLGRLGPGELFGEMSLVDDLLTSARVTASAPSRLLKLSRADFQKLLADDPELSGKIYRAFCKSLCDRLRRTNLLLSTEHAHAVAVH